MPNGNELGSVFASSRFWKRLGRIEVNSLNFGRIIQLNCVDLKAPFSCVNFRVIKSVFVTIVQL